MIWQIILLIGSLQFQNEDEDQIFKMEELKIYAISLSIRQRNDYLKKGQALQSMSGNTAPIWWALLLYKRHSVNWNNHELQLSVNTNITGGAV